MCDIIELTLVSYTTILKLKFCQPIISICYKRKIVNYVITINNKNLKYIVLLLKF